MHLSNYQWSKSQRIRKITQRIIGSRVTIQNDELQEKIGQIITCNDVLKQQIEDLNKHRNYSYEVDKLSDRNKILEENSKFILKELVSYRNELKVTKITQIG